MDTCKPSTRSTIVRAWLPLLVLSQVSQDSHTHRVMPKICDVLKMFTSANNAAGPPKSKPFYVKSSKGEITHRAGLHPPARGTVLHAYAPYT
jgi:hypothetical protein